MNNHKDTLYQFSINNS